MKIVDLSHILEESMYTFPGTEKPVFRESYTIEHHGYSEHSLSLTTHTGTHLDAPSHLLKDGKKVNEYNVSAFFGKAIRIDCTNRKYITSDTIKKVLTISEPIDFILLYTAWDNYWNLRKYSEGFPVLDPDTAEYIASLPLKGIGIDAVSFDPVENTELANHKMLMNRNILLIENLCNLSLLPENSFLFSCFPLNIKGADGSPVRATAII
jgi:arylformamidase